MPDVNFNLQAFPSPHRRGEYLVYNVLPSFMAKLMMGTITDLEFSDEESNLVFEVAASGEIKTFQPVYRWVLGAGSEVVATGTASDFSRAFDAMICCANVNNIKGFLYTDSGIELALFDELHDGPADEEDIESLMEALR